MEKYKFFDGIFYPYSLKDLYSNWPDEGVDVNEDVFIEFTSSTPADKVIGVGVDGYPVWEDLPPPSNAELLHLELELISSKYKAEISDLNQAYLAAIVSDGPGEVAKQAAVRDAIDDRKSQYVAEKDAARQKYPV